MIIDSNTTYYLLDKVGGKIFILNDEWNYITYKVISAPLYIVNTDNKTLYISSMSNIYKTDKYLNLLGQYTATNSPSYRGIYFNPKNILIYVASFNSLLTKVDLFNLNLTFNDSIQVSPFTPFSITGNNDKLYIGTSNGSILVVVNKNDHM